MIAPAARPDLPGAIGSALAIVLGATVVVLSAGFSDLGAVFPRTVGALLVLLEGPYLALVLLGRTRRAAQPGGSMPRRAAAAAVMMGFALGPFDFLASSAAATAALLLIASHGRWRWNSLLLQAGAVALVLAALYALFKVALLVPPLP